ncbi:uncharacterized protein ACLA_007240 [Aspergillus clavatus NRRL 1]|uniref:Uncharacterized protein n=1 Tax=Aspergillus clavatus (strain ATCC 1007 / CBS 513.65 / DSM 816 / NCTC 3887 / NRRL 1 / QM 1276 / 107) TaxID=344612 RepID=A1CDN8_ASPCL|nr:uncharacterized protein ACLA_007240 [Aspergillus clavatus NRRL 1]EAW11965.1 hypothetical protein ACLA_007240 [Aspergillus clavatus NRRL 1]
MDMIQRQERTKMLDYCLLVGCSALTVSKEKDPSGNITPLRNESVTVAAWAKHPTLEETW